MVDLSDGRDMASNNLLTTILSVLEAARIQMRYC